MEMEFLISVLALTVGGWALIQAGILSKRVQAAEAAVLRAEGKLVEVTERLAGVELMEPSQVIEATPTLEELASQTAERRLLARLENTSQVLELRAREHDALLCSLVTEDEARHLWNVSREQPMPYDKHGGVEVELRSLVRRGLMKKRGDFRIHELPDSFDLRELFSLTEAGEMLLSLRQHLEVSDNSPKDSLPPQLPDAFDAVEEPSSTLIRQLG